MITAGGKTDAVFLSWAENSILSSTAMSPIKLVEKLFPKLEHTPIFVGYRLNQHIIYLKSILDTAEEVIYLFTGLAKNWNGATVVCALTTKDTLIFASKPVIGEKNKRISISDIKEVTVISELLNCNVVFETLTEKFAISVDSSQNANEISKIVRSYIANYKTEKNKSEINYSSKPISVADELIKFKQLLDAGILSQEDFEKMKDKLLK